MNFLIFSLSYYICGNYSDNGVHKTGKLVKASRHPGLGIVSGKVTEELGKGILVEIK